MDKIAVIKDAFPGISWELFEEMDRSLNWELWHGPLPENYWTEVEPLDLYTWEGFLKAEEDIREILDDLPWTAWIDTDAEYLVLNDPYEDDENYDDDGEWVGGEYELINLRHTLMYPETWKQVF